MRTNHKPARFTFELKQFSCQSPIGMIYLVTRIPFATRSSDSAKFTLRSFNALINRGTLQLFQTVDFGMFEGKFTF